MAIKDLYPSIHPTLDLNFAGTRTVDPRITFSRASTATYFDEFGVMRTVPVNTPRIDFDPVTGECKGLLLEEQRTNLLTYSEQFDNGVWGKSSVTVTTNAIVALDGAVTADKFETTGAGVSYSFQVRTLTQGQPYTLSVYVKYISGSSIVWLRDFTDVGNAKFDIINMAVVDSEGIASNPQIVNCGNGWCRISVVFTPTIATGNHSLSCIHFGSQLAGNAFYAWGAQLEDGSFPTSYTPTTSAQVTRAADSAIITGSNFSDWYRQDEGTLLAAYSRNSDKANGNQIPYMVSDGTVNNIIGITDNVNGTGDRVLITDNGVVQVNTGPINYTADQLIIRSVGYKLNNVATSSNGAVVQTDDSALIPAVNQLSVGFAPYFSSSRLNGHIRRFAYYPKRLSNPNLQALTT